MTIQMVEYEGRIPEIEEMIGLGGHPGIEYLYALHANELRANAADYRRTMSEGEVAPPFHLKGPDGECDFIVMQKGKVMMTVSPHSTRCQLLIDPEIYKATGIKEKTDGQSSEQAGEARGRRSSKGPEGRSGTAPVE